MLILMLLVAEKSLKPWHMGTHLSVVSESYPMNTFAKKRGGGGGGGGGGGVWLA